jgi:DNA-binding LytR/AlgR family response regulator
MFRVAICDDEQTSLVLNKGLTEKILTDNKTEFAIETFTSMNDLLNVMEERRNEKGFDLLLCDILTNEMNGIDAARQIRLLGDQLDIIFISSTAEYALDGYAVQALRYLKKPIDIDKLREAILLSVKHHENTGCIHIMVDLRDVTLQYSDIFYVESATRDVNISTGDNMLTTHEKISDMEKLLPEDQFYRCHRAYVVNLAKVKSIERYEITLVNGEKILVSQQMFLETRNKIKEYRDKQKQKSEE